uniref:Putative conserved membrane protein n=1 Tax=Paulinella longichromatophora TaxID=1708747 RepID=A0A2H4ZNT5_9EUKA|nr:putative conserved membrane protein [Paulinella longichromatophora]
MLVWLGTFDPAPLFILSLFTYIPFLWWAQRSNRFPKIALFGFFSTLLFVLVSILGSILAKMNYEANLVEIDFLHGGAEFFLTLSNLLIVIGFSDFKKSK